MSKAKKLDPGKTRPSRPVEPLPAEEPIRAAVREGNHQKAAIAVLELYGSDVQRFMGHKLRDPELGQEAFQVWALLVVQWLARVGWRSTYRGMAYRFARWAMYRVLEPTKRRNAREVLQSSFRDVAEAVSSHWSRALPSSFRERLAEHVNNGSPPGLMGGRPAANAA